MGIPSFDVPDYSELFAEEKEMIGKIKKAFLMVAGGAVQIITKDIPDQNFLSFGFGAGYNSQSTFKDFLGTQKSSLNYLGFDDGSKQLAANFPSRKQIVNGLSTVKNRSSLISLPNDFIVKNNTALPNQNYQFNRKNT
jgi:hypothetical protein